VGKHAVAWMDHGSWGGVSELKFHVSGYVWDIIMHELEKS
jgi:hypothetical protein